MKILILLLFFMSLSLLASGDHKDEEGGDQELPSGITYFNDEEGEFSLKENVIKNFELKTTVLSSINNIFNVPNTALVKSLKKTSIFLLSDGKFRDVEVQIISQNNDRTSIQLKKTYQSINVVIKGVNFLKTIQLSLEEGPSEGHGH